MKNSAHRVKGIHSQIKKNNCYKLFFLHLIQDRHCHSWNYSGFDRTKNTWSNVQTELKLPWYKQIEFGCVLIWKYFYSGVPGTFACKCEVTNPVELGYARNEIVTCRHQQGISISLLSSIQNSGVARSNYYINHLSFPTHPECSKS